MIWLVRLLGAGSASPTLEAFYFASAPYQTEAGDDPANIAFQDGLVDPANLERYWFGPARTRGASEVARGPIEIANPGGAHDGLLDYSFVGRAVDVWTVNGPEAAWSSRALIFSGVIEQIEFSWTLISVRARDRLALLDRPLQPSRFDGSNGASPGDDISGKPDDIAGRVKPMLFGQAFNVPAPRVNTSSEVHAVNFDVAGATRPIASVNAAWSAGATYTLSGADRADKNTLLTTTPAAGQADTCLAEGLVRTNGSHAGTFALDVVAGATAADRTAAQLAAEILALHGYTLDAGDVAQLDAENPAVCGLFVAEEVTILDAAQRLLQSIGAGLYTDSLGGFRAARLLAPSAIASASVVATWTEADLVDDGGGLERLAINDEGAGVPVWQVIVQYKPNFLVQTAGEVAGSVLGTDREGFLALPFRQVEASDPAIREIHAEAGTLEVETYLATEADAAAEAARLLALYGTRRDLLRVTVATSAAQGVDLGDVVTLAVPRWGLAAGKDFLVLAREDQAARDLVTFEVWG